MKISVDKNGGPKLPPFNTDFNVIRVKPLYGIEILADPILIREIVKPDEPILIIVPDFPSNSEVEKIFGMIEGLQSEGFSIWLHFSSVSSEMVTPAGILVGNSKFIKMATGKVEKIFIEYFPGDDLRSLEGIIAYGRISMNLESELKEYLEGIGSNESHITFERYCYARHLIGQVEVDKNTNFYTTSFSGGFVPVKKE